MILYYSPGACSIAPHIVLEEIGVSFEARRVAIAAGEHRTPEYRAINPAARVPALGIGTGEVLTEVPALLVYLAGLRPEAGLLPPTGSAELGRCLSLLAFLSSGLHIAYAQYWRPERFLADEFPQPQRDAFVARGKELVAERYREAEARIGSIWAVGDGYSVADAYLFPFYRWGIRIGLDMALPNWTRNTEQMLDRPAVCRVLAREGLEPSEFLPAPG